MNVTDEQIERCAERESEIDRGINRLARSAMTYGGLGAAEKRTMSELLDERTENREALGVYNDDDSASSTRRTKPQDPGRRAGDPTKSAVDFEKRGWERWTLPARQDLDNLDDGGFRNLAEQLRAIKASAEGRFDKRLEGLMVEHRAGQAESTGETGGFLVAPRHMNEVLMSVDMEAPWLNRRNIFRLRDTNAVVFPTLQDEDRSGDEVAGLSLIRTGEAVTLTEDSVKIGQATLKLHKASKLVPISNELMADSAVAMDTVINRVFGRAVALLQAKDFFTGSGSGEPLGFANGADLHDTASGTAAGSLLISDLAGMLARLELGANPAWLLHPSVFPALASLRFSTTAGEAPMFSPNASAAAPRSIYGIPYFFTDSAKTLDTLGDINLVNLGAYIYLFTDMIVDVSIHAKFTSDETTFRLKLRDAGQPWRSSKLTDRQSYLQANFVRLATRT